MSVFLSKPIGLDLAAMRTGLAWALSWTQNAILCKLEAGMMQLIVAEPTGFIASWSWPLVHIRTSHFFLIPTFVARTLSGPAAWEANGLEVMINRNVVGLILRSGKQDFRLQWRWHADSFQAPNHFKTMNQVPETMISLPYIKLADIIHLSIAKIITPSESDEPSDKNVVLVDFIPGQIHIDGTSITQMTPSRRYYFHPKMLIRGLEIVRERQVNCAIRAVRHDNEAILHLSSYREGWQVHCAIFSAGVEKELSATTIVVRETRPPMNWLTTRN